MKNLVFVTIGLFLSPAAFGFESAKVLPKGVRNVNIRSVNTDLSHKTDRSGNSVPLSKPLAQDLTFEKIANGEDQLNADLLRGFLLENGFDESDSVGRFSADLQGHINVTAPIIAYGLTDKTTIAVAIPYYDAATAVEVGFSPNETAVAFLTALADDKNNNASKAAEVAGKLNNAVGRLNDKLATNGYRELEDWNARGLGDVTIAAKHALVQQSKLELAATGGLVAPTGRVDDPDILNDIAFGDGQWDVFGQATVDEHVGNSITLNQFAKYTHQLPGRKPVREATDEEAIEVEKKQARFKLGDKVDLGTSVQWQPSFGLVSGVGYTYFQKYADLYRDVEGAAKDKLERDTEQRAHNTEFVLGYSTVPLFKRGEFAVPFEMKLTYVRQLASRNMPVTDLAQFDLSLFF